MDDQIGLTVNEWLARIDVKLDGKADKADLAVIDQKIAKHDERLDVLERSFYRAEISEAINRETKSRDRESWRTRAMWFGGVASFFYSSIDMVSFLITGKHLLG